MKLAPSLRLLVAAWAVGGDLEHVNTSQAVVFCSILVAKLGRWMDCQVERRVVKGSV